MGSLRQVIRDNRYEICNNIAWVAIYKEGRSWAAEAFYPEDGDYENEYVFDEYALNRMKEIVDTDHKEICVNGDYMGGLEDFTLDELENRILWFYETRLHQLKGDFMDGYIIPIKAEAAKNKTVDGLIDDARAVSEQNNLESLGVAQGKGIEHERF